MIVVFFVCGDLLVYRRVIHHLHPQSLLVGGFNPSEKILVKSFAKA